MKEKSIFKQLLFPMIAIVSVLSIVLASAIVLTVSKSYEKEVLEQNLDKSKLVAGEISAFMDGAYGLTEELSKNPSILTMNTDVQTQILADCVSRNPYLELLYIQGTDGMQTGRSSGKLADRSTRWWFVQTMQEQKAFVSKSYYSVNTGMPCASIFFPMYKADNLLGVFAVDIKLDYLQSLIEQFSDAEGGEYSFVIDGEGVVVAHPDSTRIAELYNYVNLTRTVSQKDASGNPLTDEKGNILTEEQPITVSDSYRKVIADVMAGNAGSGKISNEGTSYYVSYASIPLKGESDSWSVITVQTVSSAMSMVYFIILISLIAAVLAIVVAVLIIAKIAHKLTSPIQTLTELVTAAAEGDFSRHADESSSNELGTLAAGFNKMSNRISTTLGEMNSFGSEVVQSSDKLTEIEATADSVNEAVKQIKAGTNRQTAEVNGVVSKASELEGRFAELKAQSKELLSNVAQTIESENAGNQTIHELEKQNETTTKMITDSYERIVALEEQSKRISGIVDTIDDISSQTGLLALNASIEAARAGEQGRGFAVVAESIGKLANDSSEATATITKIITELCNDIEGTVANIEAVNKVVMSQSGMVVKVEQSFDDFRVLAKRTEEAMSSMEKLVNEMGGISKEIVAAVENIRGISQNTEGITDAVSDKLEEQLAAISLVAQRVNDLSMVTGR